MMRESCKWNIPKVRYLGKVGILRAISQVARIFLDARALGSRSRGLKDLGNSVSFTRQASRGRGCLATPGISFRIERVY